MPPAVLTCHSRDVVPRLQAVRCCHHPFLIDNGPSAEAQTSAVHQVNLWEQKETAAVWSVPRGAGHGVGCRVGCVQLHRAGAAPAVPGAAPCVPLCPRAPTPLCPVLFAHCWCPWMTSAPGWGSDSPSTGFDFWTVLLRDRSWSQWSLMGPFQLRLFCDKLHFNAEFPKCTSIHAS